MPAFNMFRGFTKAVMHEKEKTMWERKTRTFLCHINKIAWGTKICQTSSISCRLKFYRILKHKKVLWADMVFIWTFTIEILQKVQRIEIGRAPMVMCVILQKTERMVGGGH